MKLRILKRHINKAINQTEDKWIIKCCPIYQAVHEKFPHLNIRCFHTHITSDNISIFNIDETGQNITKLKASDWQNLKPQTITLTKIK